MELCTYIFIAVSFFSELLLCIQRCLGSCVNARNSNTSNTSVEADIFEEVLHVSRLKWLALQLADTYRYMFRRLIITIATAVTMVGFNRPRQRPDFMCYYHGYSKVFPTVRNV